MHPRLKALLALLGALLTFLAGWGASPDDGTTTTRTIAAAPPATAVDGPDADSKRDDVLPLDARAQDALEDVAEDGNGVATELEDPLREDGDTPAGVLEGPLAAQEFPGCRTAFVNNFSSRGGVAPRVIVWHQTVSRERGQTSQNALTAYANSASSGVSWHFLIGRTNGLCTYSVPLNLKAWTQGNANPFSIGIEVEAYGDEGAYVTGKGKAKLLAVTRRLGKRFGIPMRRAVVVNCRVVKSGILEHVDLGACGGGHIDVTLSGVDELIAELARPVCSARCHRAKALRAKHQRTHARFRQNDCARKHEPRHGYCRRLRARNAAVHEAARREKISLRGTYR